jgi:hypothetical protein
MGMYINNIGEKIAPRKGKADFILKEIKGAMIVPPPTIWHADLVCVVDNVAFDAAGYAYSKEEMDVFLESDGRPRQWLLVPNAKDYAK